MNGKPHGEKNLTVLELTIMHALWEGARTMAQDENKEMLS